MYKKVKRLLTWTLATIMIVGAIPAFSPVKALANPAPESPTQARPQGIRGSDQPYWPPNPPAGHGIFSNSPLLIASAEDLLWVHNKLMARRVHRATYPDPYSVYTDTYFYKLIADITLPDDVTIGYMGNLSLPTFADFAEFDGNNHTITINNPNGYGLFSPYNVIDFRNLTIDGDIGVRGTSSRDSNDCQFLCICMTHIFNTRVPYPSPQSADTWGNIFENVNLTVTWWSQNSGYGLPIWENPLEEEPEEDENIFHYVYHDHIIVIDAPLFSYITQDGVVTINFYLQNNTINDLAVGDTFVIEASLKARHGLSGHVTNISRVGSTLIVTAYIPLYLDEIFAELVIRQDIYFLQQEGVIVELATELQGLEGVELIRNPNQNVRIGFDGVRLYGGHLEVSGGVTLIDPRGIFRYNYLEALNRTIWRGALNQISFSSNYEIDLTIETLTNMYISTRLSLVYITVPVKYVPLTLEYGVRFVTGGSVKFEYTYGPAFVNFGWDRSRNDRNFVQRRWDRFPWTDGVDERSRMFFYPSPGSHNVDVTLRGFAQASIYIQGAASIAGIRNIYGVIGDYGMRIETGFPLPEFTGTGMELEWNAQTPTLFPILTVSSLDTGFGRISTFSFHRNFLEGVEGRPVADVLGLNVHKHRDIDREPSDAARWLNEFDLENIREGLALQFDPDWADYTPEDSGFWQWLRRSFYNHFGRIGR